jgi:Asp-tRNA(Asn)/Glu-tRNA(Gln) amidotransferase A subunit family amidase
LSLANSIRNGQISSVELVEMSLRRIEAVNPEINAIVTLVADAALAAAKRADARIAAGQSVGPLHGVPFTVKDVIATGGVRTTAGSMILRDFVPARTATAVSRLEVAGAIMIGKTNCPEFALDLNTSNRLFGQTRNPLDLSRTPGGSSGGDSAAVAANCAAFGVGTDYGGSIRWPAHCTGLASLRPTPGIVPGTGQLPFTSLATPLPPPNSLSVQGQQQVISPIARSVEDLFPILCAMAGPDDLDVHTVPVVLRNPQTVDIRELRCAWFEGEGSKPVRTDIIRAVEDAARCLADSGVPVVNQRPPAFDEAEAVFARLRSTEGVPDHLRLIGDRSGELTDGMRAWIDSCVTAPVAEYLRLGAERDAVRAKVLAFMTTWPILLLPVAGLPAYAIGQHRFAVEGIPIDAMDIHIHCRPMSILRLPVAAVPCGTSVEGLPIAIQVVGRPFADHEVLAVAKHLESEFGRWSAKLKGEDHR